MDSSRPQSSILVTYLQVIETEYSIHFDDDDFKLLKRGKLPAELKLYEMVGTDKGVICMKYGESFALWNPCLDKVVLLPAATSLNNYPGSIEGFWFDSTTHEYRVLIVCRNSDHVMTEAYVFSLVQNSWRKVNSPPPNYQAPLTVPCLVNGILYWPTNAAEVGSDEYRIVVVGFDVRREEFIVLESPDSFTDMVSAQLRVPPNILPHTEGIAVIDESLWIGGPRTRVWVKDCRVDGPWTELPSPTPPIPGKDKRIVGFKRDGKVLVALEEDREHHYDELVSFDSDSADLEIGVKQLAITAKSQTFTSCPFVPSLALMELKTTDHKLTTS